MMADEFNFLRPEIKNYKGEADADLIPNPGHLELHDRCKCGVLPSTCFCALFVADRIVGMKELEVHCRRRGRYNSEKLEEHCVRNPHIQESPNTRAEVFPGLPARVSKTCRKSPRTLICSLFDSFSGHLGLFRHFFDTRAGRPGNTLIFETFWGFRAQRASGLLYMAAPIARIATISVRMVVGVFNDNRISRQPSRNA